MSDVQLWLSVIVPAYNAESYLAACVASIDPVSHPDVQVIVVDDGSTDSTPAFCDDIASRYQNVVAVHCEHAGPSHARNAGFALAEGRWVWFVDSDDLVAPNAFDLLKPIMEESDADAVQVAMLLFQDGGNLAWLDLPSSEEPVRYAADEYTRGLHSGAFSHHLHSLLVRAETLRERKWDDHPCTGGAIGGVKGPIREDFSLYEDVVTVEGWVRCFNGIDVTNLQLYGYRQTASSLTHRRSNSAADSGLRAVREIECYEVSSGDADAKKCMEISLLFSAYRLAEGHDGRFLKEEIRREIEERIAQVGVSKLGVPRLVRFILLKTRLMDFLIWAREHKVGFAGRIC